MRGAMQLGMKKNTYMSRSVIPISAVRGSKLKGKPKCPVCGTSLMFVYGDTQGGHIDQKCHKCGNKIWVDLATMECQQIVDDPVENVVAEAN